MNKLNQFLKNYQLLIQLKITNIQLKIYGLKLQQLSKF